MKKSKNKKLIILSGISLFMILGVSLAYFTTSDSIKNIFNTAKYETKIVEEFISPSDWTPGTTTPKSLTVTNNGSIDMAIRSSYSEKWVNENGIEIPLKDNNNNLAAIINFNNDWILDSDGYYYYGSKNDMKKLKPNETSSSFITSVTFNENISANLKRTESQDGKIITYESTGTGYDNANYILIIKIDTIQNDQAIAVW